MADNGFKYRGKTKAQMFDTLRREILAARLKVTLDERQGRITPAEVKALAATDLPPAEWATQPKTMTMQ